MTENDRHALEELSRQARRLRIRALRPVRDYFSGSYASAFHGPGMDFHDFAPYMPGDDVRHIDWQVTARRVEPYVRRHVEERQLRVIIAMDASPSMDSDGARPTKRERACAVAATIALSAADNGDMVGGIFFGEDVLAVIPPRRGEKHALALLRRALEPAGPSEKTDMRPVLMRLRKLRGHAIVILLSDFLTDPPPWRPELRRLLLGCARKHDLLAAVLTDGRDEPGGRVIIEAVQAESGRAFFLDNYGRRGGRAEQLLCRHAERVAQTLIRSGVQATVLAARDDHHAKLRGLLQARQRSRSG